MGSVKYPDEIYHYIEFAATSITIMSDMFVPCHHESFKVNADARIDP